MLEHAQRTGAFALSTRWLVQQRLRSALGDERGEGIISAAIAVLVMAFLGALMWAGFQTIFNDTQAKTQDQLNQIGG